MKHGHRFERIDFLASLDKSLRDIQNNYHQGLDATVDRLLEGLKQRSVPDVKVCVELLQHKYFVKPEQVLDSSELNICASLLAMGSTCIY